MNESLCVRYLCGRHERTLETQQNFEEIARSKDIEIENGSTFVVECSGNLSLPVKSNQRHNTIFTAFEDNKIQLVVKVVAAFCLKCIYPSSRLSVYTSSKYMEQVLSTWVYEPLRGKQVLWRGSSIKRIQLLQKST